MKYELNFSAEYKGKLRDAATNKLSTYFWVTFIGVIVLFCGFYLEFFTYYRVITYEEHILGKILIVCGAVLIVSAPFVAIAKGFNKGLKGEIRFVFEKKEGENEWTYALSAIKNGLPVDEYGTVSLINIKKRVAEIQTDKNSEYYIPLKELSDEQRHALAVIENEVRSYRIAQTAQNAKNTQNDKK